MYYIEWRGYGLLGCLPPLLALVILGFLTDYDSFRIAALGGTLTLAVTGAGVGVAGWVLNRNGNHHALYGLPLWFWGATYTAVGLGLAGWVGFLVHQSGWKH